MKSRNLYINIAAIFCLTSCAQPTKVVSTSSPATAPTTNKELLTANPKTDTTTTIATTSASLPDTTAGITTLTTKTVNNTELLSNLSQKLLEHKLDKLPNNAIICIVNNVPLTIGDYRREFKVEQQEVQASLTYNADLANRLLQGAHKQGIVLSPKEQATLLDSTSKMQIGGRKSFDKMLSEGHMTKKQFDDQVLSMGLACKTANIMMERNLLNGMINRLLLSQAAKDNGYSKEAMNKYTEVSKSADYKKMLASGAFSPEDLRNEIINNELCNKEAEKINNDSPLTDVELNDFYEKNRGKFRHGARIRLSQIFIAPPVSATKETAEPTSAKNQKYQLALSCLEKAQQGGDFAVLADKYSEDPDKKKNDGGDLGLQEEAKLNKDFAGKIVKLAAGTIVPEVIISQHGYHIFKITSKESPGFYRLEEVKGELKGVLAQEKSKQVLSDWLTNQRQKATIIVSPELASMLASNQLASRDDLGFQHKAPRRK